MTVLSNQQTAAYDRIMRWADDPASRVFKLAGYAGSGKSTLIKHIVDNLNEPPICCAPTGKAASVVAKKLDGIEVSTVHSLLYRPIGDRADEVEDIGIRIGYLQRHLEKHPDDADARNQLSDLRRQKAIIDADEIRFQRRVEEGQYKDQLVIVDEASMVTPEMAADFEYTGAKVLFVGDPGQLPPVKAAPWFRKPDVALTEVHRQALDNPIVRLSMDIRQNRAVKWGDYNDGKVVFVLDDNVDPVNILADRDIDIILTHRVQTYQAINAGVRGKLGYRDDLPQKGEKLVCRLNNKDFGLINGIEAVAMSDARRMSNAYRLDIDYDNGIYHRKIKLDPYYFRTHYEGDVRKLDWYFKRERKIVDFDWAYALTVHRAQGSEWPTVALVADVSMPDTQLLYTAVTRASERFVLMRTHGFFEKQRLTSAAV